MRTLDDRTPALSRAGNFWSTILRVQDRELVRHMAHTAFLARVDDALESTARACIGGGWTLQDSVEIPWNPADVLLMGPDLQERALTLWAEEGAAEGTGFWVTSRPTEFTLGRADGAFIELTLPDMTTFVYQAGGCDYIVFPVEGEEELLPVPSLDLRPKWIVPCPLSTRPHVIEVPGRFLVAGIDFIWQTGALIFEENPHALFQESIVCQAAWVHESQVMVFAQGVDLPEAASGAVAVFQQEAQTPETLRRALAEILRRPVAERDRLVTTVQSYCTTRVYQLDGEEMITVDYAHDDYAVGDVIPAGAVIGGGVEVYGSRVGASGSWWRKCPWEDGLLLRDVSPFKSTGIYIPNAPCRFEAYATTGGNLHVRPWLPGTADDYFAELQRYWNWIKSAEIQSDKYLNDILGLAAEGDDTMINALDFYFENGLKDHAIVIYFDPLVITSEERLRCEAFLERERMHNVMYIVLPHYP